MAQQKRQARPSQAQDAPSVEDLARRFLDLWQDQVAALALDPETNALLGRLVETQLGAAEAMLKATATTQRAGDEHGAPSRGSSPRAEAAAAASVARERELDELARRLAACEKRLADLEGGAKRRRRSARNGARRKAP